MAKTKRAVTAVTTRAVVTVDMSDCLEGFTDDGRRVFMRLRRNHGETNTQALRALARKLTEVADARDQSKPAVLPPK